MKLELEGPEVAVSAPRTILLTVLGVKPTSQRYTLGEECAEATIATIALCSLLPDAQRPGEVVALCTREARDETFPALEAELRERCTVRAVEVPGARTQDEIERYLHTVVQAVPPAGDERIDLILDLTHGFRHLPFLTYVAVMYLTALSNVRLVAAYYGMLERGVDVAPFLDLQPLLTLPRWFHAVEVLRRWGDVSPIAELVGQGAHGQQARQIDGDLRRLSRAYLAGQPLELGRLVNRFRRQRKRVFAKLLRNEHRLPLAKKLVRQIDKSLRPFEIPGQLSGDGWKRDVVLNEDELQRQASLIDGLFERGHRPVALGLLREWVVSWALLRLGRTGDWLEREARETGQNHLGALRAIAEDSALGERLTPQQRELAEFWGSLSDLRNAYHHHAMRRQDMSADQSGTNRLKRIVEYWCDVLRPLPQIDLQPGGARQGNTLVSPIGMRPGVLFSAVRVASREASDGLRRCLVICSKSTRPLAAEALARAAPEPQPELEYLELEDEFGGTDELDSLVRRAKPHLIPSAEVLVNVTGGTTLMGLLAESIATAARRLACPVRRFGLIDRRPPREQEEGPYVEGEPFWLDSGAGDGDAD